MNNNGWISVDVALPRHSGEYLVRTYRKFEHFYVVSFSAKNQAWNSYDGIPIDENEAAFDDVTHWMPVPKFPKEEQK